jgi:hypothetical protein
LSGIETAWCFATNRSNLVDKNDRLAMEGVLKTASSS